MARAALLVALACLLVCAQVAQAQAPAPAPAPLEAAASLEAATPSFTLSEVAQHATPEDAWIAVYDKVFDITEWIPEHPGGPVIIEYIGTDATDVFIQMHGNELPEAQAALKGYYIGELVV